MLNSFCKILQHPKINSRSTTDFDNLKKKQQNQAGKNWCYTKFYVTDNLKYQNY